MRFAHMIKSRKGNEIETQCGRTMKIQKGEHSGTRWTLWQSRVTCKICKEVMGGEQSS